MKKKKFLLHCCCAPCSAYVANLLKLKYKLTLFYYNPNIHPKIEYEKRLDEMKKFAKINKIDLIVGNYDMKFWFDKTKGYANEPERGRRCKICYYERLDEAAKYAKEKGFDIFGTTLSISPHKSAEMINSIGEELCKKYGVEFLKEDFKKKDGFKKSLQLSDEYNFYRQDYCGCLYSQMKI